MAVVSITPAQGRSALGLQALQDPKLSLTLQDTPRGGSDYSGHKTKPKMDVGYKQSPRHQITHECP